MDLPAAGQAQSQTQPQQPAQSGAVPAAKEPAPTQQSVQPSAPTTPPPASGSASQPQAAPQGPTAATKPGNGARVQRASETPGKALTASLPAKQVQEPPKEKLDPAKDSDVLPRGAVPLRPGRIEELRRGPKSLGAIRRTAKSQCDVPPGSDVRDRAMRFRR